MIGINPLGEEIEDHPAFRAGVLVNWHSYRTKLRLLWPSVKGWQKFRNPDSDFGIRKLYFQPLLQPIEILLKNLPIFETLDLFHRAGVNTGFVVYLGRLIDFVEKASITDEYF